MPLPPHPLLKLHLSRLGAQLKPPAPRWVPTAHGEVPVNGVLSSLLLRTDWPSTRLSHQHSQWSRLDGVRLGGATDPREPGLFGAWTRCGFWNKGSFLCFVRPPGWEASQNPLLSFVESGDRANALRDIREKAKDWAWYLGRMGPEDKVCGSLEEARERGEQVEVLCLEAQRIRELPAWVADLPRLKVLHLAQNELQRLPQHPGAFPALEYLDLSYNRNLENVEGSWNPALKALRLSATRINPGKWLERLTELEYLEVNALPDPGPTLPPEPLHLPSLTCLVGGWQPWAVEIPGLERLEGYLPEDAMPLLRKARDLKVLFAKTRASYVPPSLYALENLQVLAGLYEVERLPPGIGWLKQLQVLSISGAENTMVLPTDIGELESLEYLSLSNCHLTRLPPSMPSLSKLQTLVFYGHNLRDLPVGFRALQALEMLDLGDGRLRQVPRILSEFPRLRKLRLARNTIGKAPDPREELDYLAGLPALEELDLTTNAFSPVLRSQMPERLKGIRVEV